MDGTSSNVWQYLLIIGCSNNVTPDFSHFGSTIPRGVTAAIAHFANKVACHVTDYAGQQAFGALTHCQHCFESCTRILGCTAMYLTTVYCFRHVFRMIQTTEEYRQFL